MGRIQNDRMDISGGCSGCLAAADRGAGVDCGGVDVD